MNRRSVLLMSAISFSTTLAGCFGESEDSSENENNSENNNENDDTNEELDPPRDLIIENNHDQSHIISVVLAKGEEIHRDEYELEPDSREQIKGVITESGEYTLEGTLEDGSSEMIEQTVYSEIWHAYVTVTENGELFLSYDVE